MDRQARLESYFDFTEDDLKHNGLGQVTGRQKQALQEKTKKEAIRLFGVFAGLAVVFIFLDRVKFSSSSSPLSWLLPTVLIGVAVVSILLRIIKRANITLTSVSGRVDFVWKEEKIYDMENLNRNLVTRRLKMQVGGRSFDADAALKNIIEAGTNVRFHVTGGGDIVSAEFLDNPKE